MISCERHFLLFFVLGLGILWGQKSTELTKPPKFSVAPPKEKAPSLIQPKENRSFLSEDYFNPQIEFKDPKRDMENPRLLFGENEQFLDPGKRYENMLNRTPENKKAKKNIYTLLDHLKLEYVPSHTNFVFFHSKKDIRELGPKMLKKGVRIGRPFPPFYDWCRISTGTLDEVDAFIKGMLEVYEG